MSHISFKQDDCIDLLLKIVGVLSTIKHCPSDNFWLVMVYAKDN